MKDANELAEKAAGTYYQTFITSTPVFYNSRTRWMIIDFEAGYKSGHAAGWEEGLEDAAKIADEHAMERGPIFNYEMGGNYIAALIRKLKESQNG